MNPVKLTAVELAVLDASIEALKEKSSASAEPVPLRDIASVMLTTVMIDATKIVGAGTRILPEDRKIISELETLVSSLRSKVSLDELLALRRLSTGKEK